MADFRGNEQYGVGVAGQPKQRLQRFFRRTDPLRLHAGRLRRLPAWNMPVPKVLHAHFGQRGKVLNRRAEHGPPFRSKLGGFFRPAGKEPSAQNVLVD